MIYDLPPQANGTAEQQIADIRAYLIRMANDLEQTQTALAETSEKALSKAEEKNVRDMQQQAATLKELIIKTADTIELDYNSKFEEYLSNYVAISQYGNYYETIASLVESTARGTIETYNFASAIESAQNTADAAEAYATNLNGQIRRGIIEDPNNPGEYHLGIAISEDLSFSGVQTINGHEYVQISSNQTFGLYTASGWEFWINGQRVGWFSSEDSRMHLSNIEVVGTMIIGNDWEITTTNGFGIKYIGS